MGTLRSAPGDARSDTLAQASTIAEPAHARAENAYTVAPGTLLSGKYRVVRTLGRGGMGVVVEAFHLELQIPVAIKVLLPDFMAYAEAAARFQREARAVTRLTSQHVARVLDVDALPSGEPFIVMEYLKGQDLAQRGREPIPLSVGEALDYIVQACDAIADAHANGVVHRDMKPANVFLAQHPKGDVVVKVLDFGVSKVVSGSTSEVSLTQTTTILGSALYMSPEQMRSAKDVDSRTDIYALGACLYEMLARRPPYVAHSFPELCAMVYSGPPMPITEWSPDVPDGLAKVIERSLAHEPDARYATVAELVHALAPYAQDATRARIEAILQAHAPHLEMPPPARKRRSLEPVFEADTGEEAPARRGRWLAWAVLAALLGAGAFAIRTQLPATFSWGAPPATASPTAAASTAPAAPTTASPSSTSAASAAPASAAASASPSAAASASASASASATASASAAAAAPASAPLAATAAPSPSVPASSTPAPAASVSARPAAPTSAGSAALAATARSSSAPSGAAPTAAAPPAPQAIPPPPHPGQALLNPDLADRTCYAFLPDGTKKTVPCE